MHCFEWWARSNVWVFLFNRVLQMWMNWDPDEVTRIGFGWDFWLRLAALPSDGIHSTFGYSVPLPCRFLCYFWQEHVEYGTPCGHSMSAGLHCGAFVEIDPPILLRPGENLVWCFEPCILIGSFKWQALISYFFHLAWVLWCGWIKAGMRWAKSDLGLVLQLWDMPWLRLVVTARYRFWLAYARWSQ